MLDRQIPGRLHVESWREMPFGTIHDVSDSYELRGSIGGEWFRCRKLENGRNFVKGGKDHVNLHKEKEQGEPPADS